MRYLSLLLIALLFATDSHAQEDPACIYQPQTRLVSFRVNDYCSESNAINVHDILSYVWRLDDPFWEVQWIKAVAYPQEEDRTVSIPSDANRLRRQVTAMASGHKLLNINLREGAELDYEFENWEYRNRRQLASLADEYFTHLEAHNSFMTLGPLSNLLRQVHPNPMLPGRPGVFTVRILVTPVPNAYAFNDGTILVTTGLLAALHSDEEVMAVLAHEVAHVVLDHSLANYKRAQRNRTLSAVLGTVAGVLTADLLGDRDMWTRMGLGILAGIATTYITMEVMNIIGLVHSREEEQEADLLAQRWLRHAGVDSTALVRALQTLEEAEGEWPEEVATASRTHPATEGRTERLMGDLELVPAPTRSPAYDSTFYPAFVANARSAIAEGRYDQALASLERVGNADPALEAEALLLKARALRLSDTSQEVGQQALQILA